MGWGGGMTPLRSVCLLVFCFTLNWDGTNDITKKEDDKKLTKYLWDWSDETCLKFPQAMLSHFN